MPQDTPDSRPRTAGTRLLGVIVAALLGLCAFVYWHAGGSLEAVRLIDRLMVRLAAVLFVISFGAADALALFPGGPTRWVFAQRRNLGIAFVVAFALHLCAIAGFYARDAMLFWSVSPPALIALRGLGAAFIALMLLRLLGAARAQTWDRLNAFGGYYVWGAFLTGFAKRVPQDPFYLLPVALLVLALLVKLAAVWRRRAMMRAPSPTRSGAA